MENKYQHAKCSNFILNRRRSIYEKNIHLRFFNRSLMCLNVSIGFILCDCRGGANCIASFIYVDASTKASQKLPLDSPYYKRVVYT